MNIHRGLKQLLRYDEEVFSTPVTLDTDLSVVTRALDEHGQTWRIVEYRDVCRRTNYKVVVTSKDFYESIWQPSRHERYERTKKLQTAS